MDTPVLTLHGLQEMLAALPPEAVVIGLYVNSTAVTQDEWLNPLAERLRGAGFVTIGICTPGSKGKCRLDGAGTVAVVGPEKIRTLERINIFIISDMDSLNTQYPQASRVLGCAHAFETAADTSLPFQVHMPALLDGWMLSFPLSERSKKWIVDLWSGFIDPAAGFRSTTPFHLIPSGYPRMGVLAQQLREAPEKPDAILYAPIGMESNYELGGNRLKKHGIRIIRTLLNAFPERTVIFRPYKNDLESVEVRTIRDAFANEARFVFDGEAGRIASFARSALLVTDLSHIAKTFAFATLRGAVYFQPWGANAQRHVRWDGGWTTWTYTGLVEACRLALSGAEALRGQIKQRRDELVMPFETALDDIVDIVRDVHKGVTREEWLTIPRDASTTPQSEATILHNIVRQYSPSIPFASATAALFNNRESPLLAAFALHSGLAMIPDRVLTWSPYLNNVVAGLLGLEDYPCVYYRDIDPEDVCRLYSLAILAAFRRNDPAGVGLAEALLESFNAFRKASSTAGAEAAFILPAQLQGNA